MSQLKFAHCDYEVPQNASDELTITTIPGTDIWRKPHVAETFDAPMLYKTCLLSSFQKARVTVSADWATLYDQGGLILAWDGPEVGKKRWVKTGIEYTNGKPFISTVGADRWADWSLLPLPAGGGKEATIEMAREEDGSLWVYVMDGDQRTPIREVTWVFESDGMHECWIGIYAAQPDISAPSIDVKFTGFNVEHT